MTPKNVHITPRQPEISFQNIPKIWLRDPIKTHFMNALSVLVPHSEKTVNEIMRENLHLLDDCKLKEEVQALIKQESAHARMHRQTNELLIEAGYSKVAFFEKLQIRLMSLLKAISTNAFIMAMPAAFEHFTAAISRDFLTHTNYWLGDKENSAIDLSNWHALEELEHQAVCYDAFNSLYNNKYRLSFHLTFIWLPVFIISTFSIQLYFLHKDRSIYKPRNWPRYMMFIGRSIKLFAKGILNYSKSTFSSWSQQDEILYVKCLAHFKKSP